MLNNTNNEMFKRMIIENNMQNKNNNITTTTNNEEQEESDTTYSFIIEMNADETYLMHGFTADRLIMNTIVYFETSDGDDSFSALLLTNPNIMSKVSDIAKKEVCLAGKTLPLTSFKHIFYNAAKNRLVDENGNIINIPMKHDRENDSKEFVKENGVHISEQENDIEIYILGLYYDSDEDL